MGENEERLRSLSSSNGIRSSFRASVLFNYFERSVASLLEGWGMLLDLSLLSGAGSLFVMKKKDAG